MASFTINAGYHCTPVVALKTFNVAFQWSPCICRCCTRPTHKVHFSSSCDRTSHSRPVYILQFYWSRNALRLL